MKTQSLKRLREWLRRTLLFIVLGATVNQYKMVDFFLLVYCVLNKCSLYYCNVASARLIVYLVCHLLSLATH